MTSAPSMVGARGSQGPFDLSWEASPSGVCCVHGGRGPRLPPSELQIREGLGA